MSLNLVRRQTKGSPLTANDHDSNLNKLEQAIEGLGTSTTAALAGKASTGAIGSSGLTMTAGILGRETGTGALQVFTLGSGLSIVNGALVAAGGGDGGGGTVTSVGLTVPTGFSVSGSPVTTSGTLALSFAAGYSLPLTSSQAIWDAAAALAATAVQPAALTSALSSKADLTDARFTDAREWSAATVTQAEAEAGTSTSRMAFTAQRIFQAVAAWWEASAAATKLAGIAAGATANSTDAELRDRSTHTGTQSAATITGLATVATTGAYNDLSGRPTLFNPAAPGAIGGTTPSTGAFTNLLLPSQASAPSTPTSGFTLYANASNALSWIGANGFIRTFDATGITANRSWSLPDRAGTVALAEDLGGSFATRAANLVLAGPASGPAAAPTFRTLVATDLPAVTYSLRQTVSAVSSTFTLDVTAANEFITNAAIAGAVTVNLSNVASIPSGYVWRGVLRFSYTSGTITWFSGNSGYTVKWDGGSAITPTANEQKGVIIEVVGGRTTIEVAALRGRA